MNFDDLFFEDPARAFFESIGGVYSEVSILEHEQRDIFSKCWLYAGHESEVRKPGDFLTRRIGGRRCVIVRDQEATLNVFLNACPHRGSLFCKEPRGNATAFTCPYHFWTFTTNGKLHTVPDPEAYSDAWDRSEHSLPSVRSESYRGFVFVTFDARAEPLTTYLGAATDVFDILCEHSETGMEIVGGSHLWRTRANWKLLVENSQDGYHVTRLHHRYLAMSKREGPPPERRSFVRHLGNGHILQEYSPPLGPRPIAHWAPPFPPELKAECEDTERRFVARLGAERAYRVTRSNRAVLIFPNLIIHDSSGGISLRTCYPEGPDALDGSAWTLAPVDESPQMRAVRLEAFVAWFGPGGMVMPDDAEVIEACQLALSNLGSRWNDNSRGMLRASGDKRMDDEFSQRSFWRAWYARVNPQGTALRGDG